MGCKVYVIRNKMDTRYYFFLMPIKKTMKSAFVKKILGELPNLLNLQLRSYLLPCIIPEKTGKNSYCFN